MIARALLVLIALLWTTRVARADDPSSLAAPLAPAEVPDASGVVDGRMGSLDNGIGEIGRAHV